MPFSDPEMWEEFPHLTGLKDHQPGIEVIRMEFRLGKLTGTTRPYVAMEKPGSFELLNHEKKVNLWVFITSSLNKSSQNMRLKVLNIAFYENPSIWISQYRVSVNNRCQVSPCQPHSPPNPVPCWPCHTINWKFWKRFHSPTLQIAMDCHRFP